MKTTIENGKITGTMLGTEDHGILTFYIQIEMNGGGCGFGGYALDEWDEGKRTRVASAAGLQAIAEIMKCVGVEKWEDLEGKYVRCEHEGWGGKILRIGNIIEEKWFSLQEFFKAAQRERSGSE